MKITLGGVPGSGKTVVARILAQKLKMKHYSMGDLRRKMAKERGLTIDEFNNLPENTDEAVDLYQKKLGKEEDNFIIDGRLSFFFIPDSLKIYLDVNPEVAAERIFNDPRPTENNFKDKQEVLKSINARIENDGARYKKYYGVNCYEKKNYDCVIDTSNLTIEGVVQKIVEITKKGSKKWKSPR
ncbi:cytidylate kinase family protein [Candidatus Woesearchaeota archaeon]|nr:cytidylate kinase family protein [Candidatus Woesearchaeota archaeon]